MEELEKLVQVTAGEKSPGGKAIRDPLIGTTIDERYKIVSLVGHGATSSVYRAVVSEGSTVAIKVLHNHLAADESLVERFKREARTASILRHPNIVAVHEYAVSSEGSPYLVMEFVEGESLQQLLCRDGWLPVEQALPIFEQVCAALRAAHEKGVIHRDLKPGNIMLTKSGDGALHVKVLDFGCAQILPMLGDTVLKLTQTGEMLGSLLYMSPEQCLDQDVDARSDCYSLGCLMYETVTGMPPLSARTAFETMNKQMTEMPAPFAKARPELGLPGRLQSIIFKAMAKAPDKRYQSISDLMDDLTVLSSNPYQAENASTLSVEPDRAVGGFLLQAAGSEKEEKNKALVAASTDLVPRPVSARVARLAVILLLAIPGFLLVEHFPSLAYAALFLLIVIGLLWLVDRLILGESSSNIAAFENLRRLQAVHEKELGAPSHNAYIPTVEAIQNAKKRVRVSITKAVRQGPMTLVIEIDQPVEPDKSESKLVLPTDLRKAIQKNRLLLQPAEKSDQFWSSLCTSGKMEQPATNLPLNAFIIIDSEDRILAIVVGPHVAWIVKSFLAQ